MLSVIFFIFGAVFGSAANALIDRLPKNISWTKGRSVCDSCKHELKATDLIPIVSYAVLRARCRYCQSPIPPRNFWVEVWVALGFGLISYFGDLGSLGATILLMGIFWVTTIIAVMDFETKLVADVMVIIWGGLVVLSNLSNLGNLRNLAGLGVGVGLIGGIWLFSKGRAMGSGDIGIAAVMGWWLSWPNIAAGLWIAFVTGAVYGVIKLIKGSGTLKSEVAFGPWLILGSWVGWVWGEKLIAMVIK